MPAKPLVVLGFSFSSVAICVDPRAIRLHRVDVTHGRGAAQDTN
jgi:hypothetical protein